MDFIIYEDKLKGTAGFPTVSASTSSPKTLYHAPMDLVYVNTGSGWQPMVQPGSNSVYSAYTSLDSTTKANVLSSATSTTSAPHAAHQRVASKVSDLTLGK